MRSISSAAAPSMTAAAGFRAAGGNSGELTAAEHRRHLPGTLGDYPSLTFEEDAVSSIAVIQARLPYVDRRSLSEAWFSALHLARSRDPIFYRRPVLASTSQLSERSCATGRRGGALAAQSRSTGVSGAIVRAGDPTN